MDKRRDSLQNSKRKRSPSPDRDSTGRSPSPLTQVSSNEQNGTARPAKRKRTEKQKKREKEKSKEKKEKKRGEVEDRPAPPAAIEAQVPNNDPSDVESPSTPPPRIPTKPKSHSKSEKKAAQPRPESRTPAPTATPMSKQPKLPSSQPNGRPVSKRGHVSQQNKNLTGFFSPEEVQKLEHYKVDFCNTNGLSAETFDRMVQHSRRDRNDEFPCHPSIITKEEFWRNIYELLPNRDRRSVYRFMRRHFQASSQRPHEWTPEQDDELAELHAIHGPKFALIAKMLGRTQDDVVQRWKNKVEHRDTMRTGPWSEEEILQLLEVLNMVRDALIKAGQDVGKDIYEMDESNIGWGTVSDYIKNTRSRQQCADKWRKIKRYVMKLRAKGDPNAVYDPSLIKRKESESQSNGRKRRWNQQKSSRYVMSDDDKSDVDAAGDTAVSSSTRDMSAAAESTQRTQEMMSVSGTDSDRIPETPISGGSKRVATKDDEIASTDAPDSSVDVLPGRKSTNEKGKSVSDDDSSDEENSEDETESSSGESSDTSPPAKKAAPNKPTTTRGKPSSQKRKTPSSVNKNRRASKGSVVQRASSSSSSEESSSEATSSESEDEDEGGHSKITSKGANKATVKCNQASDSDEDGSDSSEESESGSESESEPESESQSPRIPNGQQSRHNKTVTTSGSRKNQTRRDTGNRSSLVKVENESDNDGIGPGLGHSQGEERREEDDDESENEEVKEEDEEEEEEEEDDNDSNEDQEEANSTDSEEERIPLKPEPDSD